MGIFENPAGIFFSAGKLKIPMRMPTLADIFSSTVKYYIMKSYRNYSECSIVICRSGFKKFGAEKRHVEFAKNRCGKKNRWLLTSSSSSSAQQSIIITMNITVHDDYYDDDDCDNDAGGCDDGCTGNHGIRYIIFDTITAAAADDDNGGIGCDNGGWHK